MNKIGTKRIETERLLLRKLSFDDADDMYLNWCTDPQVCKFYTWTPHENIDETKSFLKIWIEEYENPLVFHWVIIEKQYGRAIGTIYLDDIDQSENSAVISCLLSRSCWGKGYATEATKAVINYAFQEAGFDIIKSHHHEENIGSGKALLKSGMSFTEKKYVDYPECPRISGNYLFYSIENNSSCLS